MTLEHIHVIGSGLLLLAFLCFIVLAGIDDKSSFQGLILLILISSLIIGMILTNW